MSGAGEFFALVLLANGALHNVPPAVVDGYRSRAACEAAGRYAGDNPATRDLDHVARSAYYRRQGGGASWSPLFPRFECVPSPRGGAR